MVHALTQSVRELLDAACRAAAPPARQPAIGTDADYPDDVENLMRTVLNRPLQNVIVNNACVFYRTHRKPGILTLAGLEAALARFPDTADGNPDAAVWESRACFSPP